MSKAKFTKGEWRFTTSKNGVKQISSSRAGNICKMWNDKDTIANAHLIEAAPEMYAALNSLVDSGIDNMAMHNTVVDLLAKARGERND